MIGHGPFFSDYLNGLNKLTPYPVMLHRLLLFVIALHVGVRGHADNSPKFTNEM
jgi:hypothetical protein